MSHIPTARLATSTCRRATSWTTAALLSLAGLASSTDAAAAYEYSDGTPYGAIEQTDEYSGYPGTAYINYAYLRFVNRSGAEVAVAVVGGTETSSGRWTPVAFPVGLTTLHIDDEDEYLFTLAQIGVDHDDYNDLRGESIPFYANEIAGGFRWAVSITCDNGTEHALWDDETIDNITPPFGDNYYTVVVTDEICEREDNDWPELFAYNGFSSSDSAIAEAVEQSEALETYKLNVSIDERDMLVLGDVTLRSVDEDAEYTVSTTPMVVAPMLGTELCFPSYDADADEWLMRCSDTLRQSDSGWINHAVEWSLEVECSDSSTQTLVSPELWDDDIYSGQTGDEPENYFYAWVHDCAEGDVSWSTEPRRFSWFDHRDDYAVSAWLDTPVSSLTGDWEYISNYTHDGDVPEALSEEVYGSGALAGIVCENDDGVDASETGDVIESYNLTDGCICDIRDQDDGECDNYQLQLYYGWSNWFEANASGGKALHLYKLRNDDRLGCSNPTRAQMRYNGTVYEATYDGTAKYFRNIEGADYIRFFDNSGAYGMLCYNSDGSDCEGWEFRYYCAE